MMSALLCALLLMLSLFFVHSYQILCSDTLPLTRRNAGLKIASERSTIIEKGGPKGNSESACADKKKPAGCFARGYKMTVEAVVLCCLFVCFSVNWLRTRSKGRNGGRKERGSCEERTDEGKLDGGKGEKGREREGQRRIEKEKERSGCLDIWLSG